jgi:hypothetical protein
MMDLFSLALISGGLLLYSLIAGRLQGTTITAPMVFVIFGFIVGAGCLDIVKINLGHAPIHFIAAFIGGMVFGNTLRHPCTFLFDFMETEGQLLMLITFLMFGVALLPEGQD